MKIQQSRLARPWLVSVLTGIALIVVGLPIAFGGVQLFRLGGSGYYLPAGLGLVVAGILIMMRRLWGVWLYAIVYLGTILWAIAEVGVQFWPLAARIVAPTVLAAPVLLSLASMACQHPRRTLLRRIGYGGAGAAVMLFIAFVVAAMFPHGAVYGDPLAPRLASTGSVPAGDWTHYGRTPEGRRYAPFDQINKQNVKQLEVAWIARSGQVPPPAGADENTPLQVGSTLVTCSPTNIIHGRDVDTGKVLWRFDAKTRSPWWQVCRSVSYYKAPVAAPASSDGGQCIDRVVMTTMDATLLERDLHTGKPCTGFGQGGMVDLKAGMGDVQPGYYFQTSAPTVGGGLIIVGGVVLDSANVDVPSGVIRAFDAQTGALRWAWDVGRSDDANALPTGKSIFTRGTPNVWAPMSIDEARGLLFLPTGNASPDHWGGKRLRGDETHSSSVVALDLATGRERWRFQTTHHDLWDYDVPAQPTLYDVPDGKGGRIPGVIQPTKRGEIFLLERETGRPITPVVERPVPQGAAPGDWTSPTQPYSTGMPTISPPRLKEADMWGISPLDQLWCRLAYRKLRYDGDFTPPRTDPSLLFPGVFGGLNWGSSTIDENSDYLIVNDIRAPQVMALVPRAVADNEAEKKKVLKRFGATEGQPGHGGLMMMKGTPFAAIYVNFVSPLGIPCNQPPYGTMTAIDLKTKKIAWQVPMGTSRDSGPLGISLRMPIEMGLPTVAGSVVTKSGLIFFAGTQDRYLRAIDSSTGREVWKARLPVGSGATPMTYVSPRTKRQYVVISASGARGSSVRGDYLIAFALPR